MALDAQALYVTDSQDVLWAFDRQTGHVKWKQEAFKGRGLTEPVLFGSHLVVGDRIGFLHVLARQSGAMIGREFLGAAIEMAPAVSERTLYVMTTDGKLHALRE